MSVNKRQFLKAAGGMAALLATGIAPHPALAEGGNDPIPGIDVIIKKDPSSVPITDFSLTGGEVARFNGLKGARRSAYLADLIAARVKKARPEGNWRGFAPALKEALGDSWCGPCRMAAETPTLRIGYNPKTGAIRLAVK